MKKKKLLILQFFGRLLKGKKLNTNTKHFLDPLKKIRTSLPFTVIYRYIKFVSWARSGRYNAQNGCSKMLNLNFYRCTDWWALLHNKKRSFLCCISLLLFFCLIDLFVINTWFQTWFHSSVFFFFKSTELNLMPVQVNKRTLPVLVVRCSY